MENLRRHGKKLSVGIFLIILVVFLFYWYGMWPFSRTVKVVQANLTDQGAVVKFIPSWNVKAPTLFCSFDRDRGRHYTESNETVGRGGPDTAVRQGQSMTIEVVFGKAEWKDMSSDEFKKLVDERGSIYCRLYQANFSSIESDEFEVKLPKSK
ncbi:hypothetical protein [Chromobacterium phragmitis]|uniref:hypothetical protein n=1 Tax=Chromobacterium phragmitis TaxID=2202141 RepID=UPI0011AE1CB5|nr:hypothetical protein [Chromobacterium phragmitis]